MGNVNASTNDSIKENKFELFKLIPGEIKYIGVTDFSGYSNGLTISKSLLGFTNKHGLSGDGFNSVYEFGVSYNFILRNHYLSVFPQFAQITWWGARWYARAEPYFNLSNFYVDYINIEIGGGIFGSISLFYLLPTTNQIDYMVGFKFGVDISNHLFFKDGRNGWL